MIANTIMALGILLGAFAMTIVPTRNRAIRFGKIKRYKYLGDNSVLKRGVWIYYYIGMWIFAVGMLLR